MIGVTSVGIDESFRYFFLELVEDGGGEEVVDDYVWEGGGILVLDAVGGGDVMESFGI